MKKFSIIGLAALIVVSCGETPSLDSRIEEYSAQIEQMTNGFMARMMELQADTLRDIEVVRAEADALYDSTMTAVSEFCIATIRENADNKLAVTAFRDVYGIIGATEALELIDLLSDENKQNDFIVKIKAELETLMSTSEGSMFVDFTVVQDPADSLASTVSFSDYVGRGKYVLVDFWASWCGPCREEIPNIASVYKQFAGDDFDVLSIAVWDEPEASVKAAKEHGIVWNQIINSQETATSLYGITAIPQIMLFGPDGTILKRDLRGERISEAVSSALGR